MPKFDRQCPMCNGAGEYTEIIDPEIGGPSYQCGFCGGTGRMTRKRLFYQALGWLSADKRAKKRRMFLSSVDVIAEKGGGR